MILSLSQMEQGAIPLPPQFIGAPVHGTLILPVCLFLFLSLSVSLSHISRCSFAFSPLFFCSPPHCFFTLSVSLSLSLSLSLFLSPLSISLSLPLSTFSVFSCLSFSVSLSTSALHSRFLPYLFPLG